MDWNQKNGESLNEGYEAQRRVKLEIERFSSENLSVSKNFFNS